MQGVQSDEPVESDPLVSLVPAEVESPSALASAVPLLDDVVLGSSPVESLSSVEVAEEPLELSTLVLASSFVESLWLVEVVGEPLVPAPSSVVASREAVDEPLVLLVAALEVVPVLDESPTDVVTAPGDVLGATLGADVVSVPLEVIARGSDSAPVLQPQRVAQVSSNQEWALKIEERAIGSVNDAAT